MRAEGGMLVAGAGRRRGRVMAALKRITESSPSVPLAGLLLLVAVAAGLLGQGGFYSPVQRSIGVLVAVATVLALAAWPPTRGDVRLPPVVPALALAAWAVLDGALL